jgi:putative addiction module CopG family antidote
MSQTLPPDLQDFVDQELASGRYQSTEEIVVEGLRLLQRDRQEAIEGIQEGLAESERGEGAPWTRPLTSFERNTTFLPKHELHQSHVPEESPMSGEDLPNSDSAPDSGEDNHDRAMKEPHLDLADIVEVAKWLAMAAASGVVGSAAYEVVTSFRRRFGGPRSEELKLKVYDMLQQVKRKPDVSDEELRSRVGKLFDEAS